MRGLKQRLLFLVLLVLVVVVDFTSRFLSMFFDAMLAGAIVAVVFLWPVLTSKKKD